MKTLKKGALALASIGLTVGLAGCGNEATKSSSSDDNDKPTVTDILNADKERQIIMTEDTGNTDNLEVRWAGVIGKGKLDAHPYYFLDNIDFNHFKNLSMKDFKEKLKKEDKEYESLNDDGDPMKINYGPRKAGTQLGGYEGDKTAKKVKFDVSDSKLGNEEDTSAITETKYSEISDEHPDGWLAIKPEEYEDEDSSITLFIKAEKGEKSLSMEDIKKAKKSYDNVKFINLENK